MCSRGDTNKYTDLNKLSRKFLETQSGTGPSRAYVEEVVEGIRNGHVSECPICLESSDDPVLTPCAHRMCRECLLSSWRTPSYGSCPICRQLIHKPELITCPSENRFQLDVDKNWTESSKITKLLDCLEGIRKSGSGEKSIVFSQWTSFLDLLEIPLRKRNFEFLRFDGKLAQKQRGKVLHEFAESKEKTVSTRNLHLHKIIILFFIFISEDFILKTNQETGKMRKIGWKIFKQYLTRVCLMNNQVLFLCFR